LKQRKTASMNAFTSSAANLAVLGSSLLTSV
jgi:hypothetical protein